MRTCGTATWATRNYRNHTQSLRIEWGSIRSYYGMRTHMCIEWIWRSFFIVSFWRLQCMLTCLVPPRTHTMDNTMRSSHCSNMQIFKNNNNKTIIAHHHWFYERQLHGAWNSSDIPCNYMMNFPNLRETFEFVEIMYTIPRHGRLAPNPLSYRSS